MYTFRLPIGDWSKDGHNECDYYIISSNTSPKDLGDIYIDVCKKTSIDKICSDYGDNNISFFGEVMDKLGLNPTLYFNENGACDGSEELAQLWIDVIQKIHPNVKMSIIKDVMVDFNNWYAQKVKGISGGGVINLPGYGLFE